MRFDNRTEAGAQLASALPAYAHRPDVIVLALPRGGVPVAAEVARVLHAPLDVFLVRKLGVPGQPELAMGAIAEGGVQVLSDDLIADFGIPPSLVQQVAARERLELERRDVLYRGGHPLSSLRDRTVILVDDGLATGSTMQAAALALRRHDPARIVIAAPVGAADTCERLGRYAEEVVCLATPNPFRAVGLWYRVFSQTTDDEVRAYSTLRAARLRRAPRLAMVERGSATTTRAVSVPVGARVGLDGDLDVPAGARGLVIFAHGSGSSRLSPRNQFVARALHARHMATLLTDLLTPDEGAVDRHTAHLRFDIELLAERLVAILDWSRRSPDVATLPAGLFGASTGAAAALVAAAHRPQDVSAVVSRGGRPDLAGAALPRVTAPTLLIVGGDDRAVIEVNQQAAKALRARTSLFVVPGASHLFEEPGALERVAELAGDWFSAHLWVASDLA